MAGDVRLCINSRYESMPGGPDLFECKFPRARRLIRVRGEEIFPKKTDAIFLPRVSATIFRGRIVTGTHARTIIIRTNDNVRRVNLNLSEKGEEFGGEENLRLTSSFRLSFFPQSIRSRNRNIYRQVRTGSRTGFSFSIRDPDADGWNRDTRGMVKNRVAILILFIPLDIHVAYKVSPIEETYYRNVLKRCALSVSNYFLAIYRGNRCPAVLLKSAILVFLERYNGSQNYSLYV